MTNIRGYGRAEAYRGGNKVYGSGRSSPHEGMTLDPTGYVNRELNKPRVDKRSRLAEAALLRFNQPGVNARGNQRVGGPITPPRPDSGGPGNNHGGPKHQPTGSDPKPTTHHPGKPPPTFPDPNNPDPTDPTQPPGPFTPPKVDLNGKLLPMPWDMQMDWMNAATSLAQQYAGWDNQVNSANMDLASALRDMGIQYGRDQQQLAGSNANRGMTYSSGNSAQIQGQANQYARNTSDAQNYVQQLIGQIGAGGSDRALAQSSFDQYSAMLQAEAARILKNKAGHLGLGDPPTNPDGNPSGNPDPRPMHPPKPKPPKGHNGGGQNKPPPRPPSKPPKGGHNNPPGWQSPTGPRPTTSKPHKPKHHRK